jgi:hypothetical protein
LSAAGLDFKVVYAVYLRVVVLLLDVVSDFIFKWICTPSADAWPIKKYDTQTKTARTLFSYSSFSAAVARQKKVGCTLQSISLNPNLYHDFRATLPPSLFPLNDSISPVHGCGLEHASGRDQRPQSECV